MSLKKEILKNLYPHRKLKNKLRKLGGKNAIY